MDAPPEGRAGYLGLAMALPRHAVSACWLVVTAQGGLDEVHSLSAASPFDVLEAVRESQPVPVGAVAVEPWVNALLVGGIAKLAAIHKRNFYLPGDAEERAYALALNLATSERQLSADR